MPSIRRCSVSSDISVASQMRNHLARPLLVAGASGYLSQALLTAAFGLGLELVVDTLQATWLSCIVRCFIDVAVDRTVQIVEIESAGCIEKEKSPRGFNLHPSYPNPLNPITITMYDLPEPVRLDLAIYDVTGRLLGKLVDGQRQKTGCHTVYWYHTNDKGQTIVPGIYFSRFSAGFDSETRQMLPLR